MFSVSQQNLTQDKPEDENVLADVLEQNTKLHARNTNFLKRLSDQEKKYKSCKAQLQIKDEEVQRLKSLLRMVEKPRTVPIVRQAPYVDTDHDHKVRYLQRQHDNLQTVIKERDDLVVEASQMCEENKILRENLEHVTSRSSGSEEKIKELSEQAKYFEVEYRTEKDDNEKLRAENKQLRQQLNTFPISETKLAALPSEDEGQNKVTIGCLQARIKQLNEDVCKLRDHSKDQSRQILRLRQQTEITKVHVLVNN